MLTCVAVLPLFTPVTADVRGTWISDPAQPGPSQPPAGHSLFDYLFTETANGDVKYAIPFPFTQLVERIAQQLPETPASNGGILQVLIPMGRSLVRNASRPDYFSSPRLVLAVDAPPRFDQDHAGLLLKDRLYIGYMEQDELLEVISYNEAAGRFEFQLVQDYGPGRKPKVSYANRQLCIACHQNAAPIFSRQQWDETNANPAIDDLLERRKARRYGVPAGAGVDIPFAIDSATDRANYYTYYQLMWQKGCQPLPGDVDSDEQAAVLCRAGLLRVALWLLLTDGAGVDSGAAVYQDHINHLQANAVRRWPGGLLVPDSDIPNRNPLLKRAGYVLADGNDMPTANVIVEAFDPLVPRAPLQWLDVGSHQASNLLVSGLAGFFANTDRQRLDQYLFDNAVAKQLVEHQEFNCVLQQKAWTGQGRRFGFDCHTQMGEEAGRVKSLRGRFTLDKGRISQAAINQLSLAGGAGLRNLVMQQVGDGAEKGAIRFDIYNGNLHARLPDGNALGNFVLEWQAGVADSTRVSARLSVLSDFDLLDEALRSLVQQAGDKRTDALSSLPFRRASVMPALFDQLGLDPLDWCCIDSLAMPVVRTEAVKYPEVAELKPFYHYCAACHASASIFPANFLYGDEARVRKQVLHCAERIYYRLSMVQKAPGDRRKSSMPPPLVLKSMGQDDATWAGSGALEALKDHVIKLIQQHGDGRPDMEQYERRGFDQLQSCLPTS